MAENDIGGALDLTVASLGEGVVRLGVSAALPEISAWQERLAASGDPGLSAVAETLSELKAQLDPDGFDPVSVGALLMSLGDQVERVAGAEVGEQVGRKLSQLGVLLGKEGDALTDRATRV
ncbi:hypothetical protein GBA63_01505 [Rubrobacter tropicus]|uniref:Uncharacterized protein n=1 Tax=Rubrobacter tropicus TaxID=2653851 RepID=A0A6G8Q4T3_9ACTN|nr:hypothetical protein [Rubrobacter tropicus]QIN81448.1 hypothetical protein GBA63_01505 [Rubrobacter tropicus]